MGSFFVTSLQRYTRYQGIHSKLLPVCSLADLYDELTMPSELRKAHQQNDRAVMQAYGFYHVDGKKATMYTESETVAELMKLYQKLVEQKE